MWVVKLNLSKFLEIAMTLSFDLDFLAHSHFCPKQVTNLRPDCTCFVLLVVRLEHAELLLIRDGESDE